MRPLDGWAVEVAAGEAVRVRGRHVVRRGVVVGVEELVGLGGEGGGGVGWEGGIEVGHGGGGGGGGRMARCGRGRGRGYVGGGDGGGYAGEVTGRDVEVHVRDSGFVLITAREFRGRGSCWRDGRP